MPNSPSPFIPLALNLLQRKIATLDSRLTFQEEELEHMYNSLKNVTGSLLKTIKFTRKRVDDIRDTNPNTWPTVVAASGIKRNSRSRKKRHSRKNKHSRKKRRYRKKRR